MIKYKFYATLLNAFQDYLSSDEIYREYWGYTDAPNKSESEFEAEQFQSLIDKINRVPLADSEAADRGTTFNEIVDCIILNRKSSKMQIDKIYETTTVGTDKPFQNCVALKATYNNREFQFPIGICREFADYFQGATPQVYTEATLPTKYGDVLVYGFIDELMPDCAHDIKLIGRYKAGKFRRGWQHIVYPYCLNRNGNHINQFEYNVAVMSGRKADSFTEYYTYSDERDVPRLVEHVERFIDFLEANRSLITDTKIFGAPNLLSQALAEIDAATTADEVRAIQKKYPMLENNDSFQVRYVNKIGLITAKKK